MSPHRESCVGTLFPSGFLEEYGEELGVTERGSSCRYPYIDLIQSGVQTAVDRIAERAARDTGVEVA